MRHRFKQVDRAAALPQNRLPLPPRTPPVPLSEQPGAKPGEKTYDAFIPAVAVNKAGVVAVFWYDRRGLAPDGKG